MNIYKARFRRAHPYTIYAYISRYLYLLLIPVVHTLLLGTDSLNDIISGAALSLVSALLVIAYSVLRFRSEGYAIHRKKLYIKKGLFFRKRKQIRISGISTLTISKKPVSSFLFGVRRLFIDVPSLSRDRGVSIYLSSSYADKLISRIVDKDKDDYFYKAKNLRVLFVAALWSNSAAGFLILSSLMSRISKLMGEQFAEKIYDTIDISYLFIYAGLPPLVAALANILVICWAISMLTILNRYIGFTVQRRGRHIITNRGVLTKTAFVSTPENINAFSINQSILMMPFHLFSTYILTISTGKAKDDRSLLIAGENYEKSLNCICAILGRCNLDCIHSLRAKASSMPPYLYLPMSVLSAEMLSALFLSYFNEYATLIHLVLLFTVPVIMLWFAFRIIAHSKACLSYGDSLVKLTGFTRLTVNTNYIPLCKVNYISIKQSVFQRHAGTCSVSVYVFSESKYRYTVKHLPYPAALSAVKKINQKMSCKS